jgi:hypothetical protein
VSERRAIVYFAGLGLFFLLLVLAAFLGRAYLSGNVDEKSWTKQNELVLAALPLYLGATEARAPYSTGEPDPTAKTKTANGGPFLGYWTAHSYTLPLGTRPDLVLAYYAQRLGDWSLEPVEVRGRIQARARDAQAAGLRRLARAERQLPGVRGLAALAPVGREVLVVAVTAPVAAPTPADRAKGVHESAARICHPRPDARAVQIGAAGRVRHRAA